MPTFQWAEIVFQPHFLGVSLPRATRSPPPCWFLDLLVTEPTPSKGSHTGDQTEGKLTKEGAGGGQGREAHRGAAEDAVWPSAVAEKGGSQPVGCSRPPPSLNPSLPGATFLSLSLLRGASTLCASPCRALRGGRKSLWTAASPASDCVVLLPTRLQAGS